MYSWNTLNAIKPFGKCIIFIHTHRRISIETIILKKNCKEIEKSMLSFIRFFHHRDHKIYYVFIYLTRWQQEKNPEVAMRFFRKKFHYPQLNWMSCVRSFVCHYLKIQKIGFKKKSTHISSEREKHRNEKEQKEKLASKITIFISNLHSAGLFQSFNLQKLLMTHHHRRFVKY